MRISIYAYPLSSAHTLEFVIIVFLVRLIQSMNWIRAVSCGSSFCLSPSVTLCTVQSGFRHIIAYVSSFWKYMTHRCNCKGNPWTRASNDRGWVRSALSGLCLGNGERYGLGYNYWCWCCRNSHACFQFVQRLMNWSDLEPKNVFLAIFWSFFAI